MSLSVTIKITLVLGEKKTGMPCTDCRRTTDASVLSCHMELLIGGHKDATTALMRGG